MIYNSSDIKRKVDAGGYDWSLVHFCANNNFQSYLKRFAKTIYNPNEMKKKHDLEVRQYFRMDQKKD